jgi:hypothetical protein
MFTKSNSRERPVLFEPTCLVLVSSVTGRAGLIFIHAVLKKAASRFNKLSIQTITGKGLFFRLVPR